MNGGEKQVPTPPLSSGKSLTNSAADPVPATAVRDQLARVVNSPGFVSSVRLCRFLTHIVNRTIDEDIDSLKEFSIAMEVFDRTSEYDPNIDAIVRVEARRLRAKLKAYYEEGQGTVDPVLIGLRPGSYVPVFRWLDAQPAKHREEIGAALPPGRICIAVLPFVNMSPEPEQDYFCDGISEEITNSLTRVSGLNVIAPTSAFHFKGASIDIREVGQRLGADIVIEGSVRKAGEQLRITAQAIQTESGHHSWSETFRRELKDVFAIQEEIAQSVADLLRLHMPEVQGAVRPSAPDLDAYTRYLQARFLIHQQSPETLHAALAQLRKLIETYPDYALAYSSMAAASGFLALFGVVSGREVYPEVKANAERGYALDPESADTCTVLGGVRGWFEHCWNSEIHLHHAGIVEGKGTCASGDQAARLHMLLDNHSRHRCDQIRIAKIDPRRDSLRQRSGHLPAARLNLPHGGFHIGCTRCVLLHCGVVVRASHGLCGVQSLRALIVQICLGLVGFCAVELRLRSLKCTLHRALLTHRRVERGIIVRAAQMC